MCILSVFFLSFFSFPILKPSIPMLLPIFINKSGFIIHLNLLDFWYLNIFISCSSSLSIAISFVSSPSFLFYILLFLVFLHLSLDSFSVWEVFTRSSRFTNFSLGFLSQTLYDSYAKIY